VTIFVTGKYEFIDSHPHSNFSLLSAPTISGIKSNKRSHKRMGGKGEGVMIHKNQKEIPFPFTQNC
jgi:hypothetical protein